MFYLKNYLHNKIILGEMYAFKIDLAIGKTLRKNLIQMLRKLQDLKSPSGILHPKTYHL